MEHGAFATANIATLFRDMFQAASFRSLKMRRVSENVAVCATEHTTPVTSMREVADEKITLTLVKVEVKHAVVCYRGTRTR
jgi:hypothetical protein